MVRINDDVHNEWVSVGNARLCAGELVDMEVLNGLPNPEPMGPKHFPVRFDQIVTELHQSLERRGMQIQNEVIGLAKERQRMVLALNIDAEDNHPEFGMHIGLFTSTDQSWANKFAFGTNVFACANTALSAEFVFSRKSTRNVMRDLPRMMNHGIGKYVNHFTDEKRFIEHWMSHSVSDSEVKEFLFDAMQSQVIRDTSYVMREVWPRVLNPTHEEHRRGTVYAVMNAFTGAEKEKARAPRTMVKNSVNMMGFMKERFPLPEQEMDPSEDVSDIEMEVISDRL